MSRAFRYSNTASFLSGHSMKRPVDREKTYVLVEKEQFTRAVNAVAVVLGKTLTPKDVSVLLSHLVEKSAEGNFIFFEHHKHTLTQRAMNWVTAADGDRAAAAVLLADLMASATLAFPHAGAKGTPLPRKVSEEEVKWNKRKKKVLYLLTTEQKELDKALSSSRFSLGPLARQFLDRLTKRRMRLWHRIEKVNAMSYTAPEDSFGEETKSGTRLIQENVPVSDVG